MKISHDVNGNKILTISKSDLGIDKGKGFSIETLGNLPYTHRNDLYCIDTTMREAFEFVKQYGTKAQKKKMQCNESYTLQNIKAKRLNSKPFFAGLSEKDKEEISQLLGGRQDTRIKVFNALNWFSELRGWYLERIEWDGKRWVYFAGQEYVSELAYIRKDIIK